MLSRVCVWQLKERLESLKINKGEHYCADPSGMRDGNGCGPQLTETIEKVVTDAEKYVDKVSSRCSRWGFHGGTDTLLESCRYTTQPGAAFGREGASIANLGFTAAFLLVIGFQESRISHVYTPVMLDDQ